MHRVLALVLAFLLVCSVIPTAFAAKKPEVATDNQPVNEEQLALLDKQAEDKKNEVVWTPKGEVYDWLLLDQYDENSPVLYTCKVLRYHSLFAERYATEDDAKTTKRVRKKKDREYTAEVLAYDQTWAIVRKDGDIGYIKRDFLLDIKPTEEVNMQPYGVQKPAYIATTAQIAHVRKSMTAEDDCWVILNPGTMLSVWRVYNGWAIVLYQRSLGYIDMRELTDMIPVSPTDTPMRADSPIAAYTSYYGMKQNWENVNRICNIRVGCQRMSRVLQPGERLDFNADVGPYRVSVGYFQAPVLVDGETRMGTGGGTCQVSSTLYNALLQAPGITIVHRYAHGENSAPYLPAGMDAAVGNNKKGLNLIVRNDYDFPIRIEGHTSDDGALLMLVYRADF